MSISVTVGNHGMCFGGQNLFNVMKEYQKKYNYETKTGFPLKYKYKAKASAKIYANLKELNEDLNGINGETCEMLMSLFYESAKRNIDLNIEQGI